ncbi:hypothetical protein K488DRAFT_85972 [Vararia minispora EC-137]|uniref:Uncharacterized protein n=1 Tax=Vararia minispora EC-137 TaxID=1314806 RepID=A0ACB8QL28_9AGAM|nr:hypothetical protein K488DRAFT_85972 [Vararia minispora EC-137]
MVVGKAQRRNTTDSEMEERPSARGATRDGRVVMSPVDATRLALAIASPFLLLSSIYHLAQHAEHPPLHNTFPAARNQFDMGLTFAPAVNHTTTKAPEPVKKTKIVCPYPKWSPGLFDPDSDEFFIDFVDERRLDVPPAPLSPVDSASSPSGSSRSASPVVPSAPASPMPLESLVRSMRADVDSLTWLTRVPADAHVVPDVRDLQADGPEPTAPARSRSISDAPSPLRPGEWWMVFGLGPRTLSREEDRAIYEGAPEDTWRPATPPMPPLVDIPAPTTPPAGRHQSFIQTPASGPYTMSPPPSVTPRVLGYDHAARRAHPPAPQSPTLRPPQRTTPLPAF